MELVNKGDADVYGFQYPIEKDGIGLDTTEYVPQMLTYLQEMGYEEFDCSHHSAEWGYYWLSEDSVWIFTGHGGNSSVWFVDDMDEDGEITSSHITAASTDENCFAVSEKPHNDLAQLQLAIFASCDSGLDDEGTSSNLVGMMYQKGTHFTIAHPDSAGITVDDIWVKDFLFYCTTGATVYSAMEYADDQLYDNSEYASLYGNVMQRHTLGDTSLCLYPEGQGGI